MLNPAGWRGAGSLATQVVCRLSFALLFVGIELISSIRRNRHGWAAIRWPFAAAPEPDDSGLAIFSAQLQRVKKKMWRQPAPQRDGINNSGAQRLQFRASLP